MIANILIPAVATLIASVALYALKILHRNWTSPLKFIDGPPCANPLMGHFTLIFDVPDTTVKWRAEYGTTFMAKSLFYENELYTTDITALSHILSHGSLYTKPYALLFNLQEVMGDGILSVDRDPHRRQRKILSPAFGPQQLRAMNEVFVEKGNMLRDMLAKDVDAAGGTVTTNMSDWFRQVTLDIIGEAGFGYQFKSLETHGKKEAELSTVFARMFQNPNLNFYRAFQAAQADIPILRALPLPGWTVTRYARKKLRAIGTELLNKSKTEAASLGSKNLTSGRDLLSLLVKANMSSEAPQSQRMSDDEVIAQIPTFFLAGHETSSLALAWATHALSSDQSVQDKLRQELLSVPTETPTMDELNALPFLENVLRETMRLHSPLVSTERMAERDDVLPLSKPYVDRQGISHESLPIRKGQLFHIPVLEVNNSKELWGEDALEFRPERWDNVPEAVKAIPGVWAHQMTFLAGKHSCMGFQFTIVEQKAILFALLRRFVFLPASEEVKPTVSGFFQRPISFVRGGSDKAGLVSAGGLRVIVKAYKGEAPA
ncbi:unnamed protein product [Mycena citricolor]|uniref:Cytochrome P450 n=1 Tax=Mycena citricolor TaxID=2018698 RepID=A0AAD2K0Z4_9AGAR|nr:unnamed protein product [Mycena citricolor]